MAQPGIDGCSYSNFDKVQSTHVELNLSVDFDLKTLTGSAVHDLRLLDVGSRTLVLDSRDLIIKNVSGWSGNSDVQVLTFKIQEHNEELGEGIFIDLTPLFDSGILKGQENEEFKVQLDYETSPSSLGLQWLENFQTSGKQDPYLFSQFEPIHARTAIPLQDSPANKITYSAAITVGEPLTALMSAKHEGSSAADGKITYKFKQDIRIPSYLIAIVAGKLESADLGHRSAVWTEKETLEAASYEFVETESYLSTAEELLTPYVWGRYDLLCLPPSFPMGGMENPCLTFVTPTLLAGDRSQTHVVAHEIAHSWTGNLVTNQGWDDFWLNEGFTVYVERQIISKKFGRETKHFHYHLGYKSMVDEIERYGPTHEFTKLVPSLRGQNPDSAFGALPYEKGSQFLFYLENLIGEEAFGEVLRKWVTVNAQKSVTSADWKQFCKDNFPPEKFEQVAWNEWFYNPGYPIVDVRQYLDNTLSDQVKEFVALWIQGPQPLDQAKEKFQQFSTMQIEYFLAELLLRAPAGLPQSTLVVLEESYPFNQSKNKEIQSGWYKVCLTSKYWTETIKAGVIEFLGSQGRMKYVRPIYRLLNIIDSAFAKETFNNFRRNYHNIAVGLIEADFKKAEESNTQN